jgi:cobalt-zinc-cadmium efflux system protein
MHDHGSHGPGGGHSALAARRGDSRRRMGVALAINLTLLGAQVAGGIVFGSLALLADAGHLLSDVGSIALGLLAAGMAARPADARRTFGNQRSEVLAAFANGIALVAVSVLIAIAAIGRLGDPPEVEGGGVLVLGAVGLLGNIVATVVLARGERSDINLEGVLRHSAADALSSVGVVAAGAVILAGGPAVVDPIAGLVIAVLILGSTWRLIFEPLEVLMEAAPPGIEMDELGGAICQVEGVRSVHDLHVWTLTAGFPALSAHVVLARDRDRDLARRRLEVMLRDRFAIEHTTLQMEEEAPQGLLSVEGAERGAGERRSKGVSTRLKRIAPEADE